MEIKYTCPKCGKSIPLKEVHFDKFNPNWHIKCGSPVQLEVSVSSKE